MLHVNDAAGLSEFLDVPLAKCQDMCIRFRKEGHVYLQAVKDHAGQTLELRATWDKFRWQCVTDLIAEKQKHD